MILTGVSTSTRGGPIGDRDLAHGVGHLLSRGAGGSQCCGPDDSFARQRVAVSVRERRRQGMYRVPCGEAGGGDGENRALICRRP